MKQSSENPRARRKPRKITPDSLGRIALHYLERYATSSENLRRVLIRRVRRSAEAHDTDPDEQIPHVDALIIRYQQAGLLDDQAYARMRAESLHRRGTSGRMIRMKLAAKGVPSDAIDDALESLSDLVANTDLSGACNYARRRRIGPWRLRDRTDLPIAVYNVSGEYAMLIATADRGWGDLHAMVRESIVALVRAGADILISYWANRYDEIFR